MLNTEKRMFACDITFGTLVKIYNHTETMNKTGSQIKKLFFKLFFK